MAMESGEEIDHRTVPECHQQTSSLMRAASWRFFSVLSHANPSLIVI
jgi:hypothetical protein